MSKISARTPRWTEGNVRKRIVKNAAHEASPVVMMVTAPKPGENIGGEDNEVEAEAEISLENEDVQVENEAVIETTEMSVKKTVVHQVQEVPHQLF